MMKKYDAIIIGGGGGLKLRPIADMGKKIAIFEEKSLGGTCLNRGCIPSKMLIHAADVAEEIQNAHRYNLSVSSSFDEKLFQVDFEGLIKRVSDFVDSESQKIEAAYQKNPNIDFYPAHARFVSDKILEVGEEQITAEKIFIATGSRPLIPNIEGLKETPFMTSAAFLRNAKQPKKLLVIGGGYIGVELGHFLGALGTEVHFLVRDRFLTHEDREIAAEFSQEFCLKHHVSFGATPQKVSYNNGQFTVSYQSSNGEISSVEGDALLVATGVVPNSDQLSLENTGITTNPLGFIQVNDHLQTSVPDVYALGDVIGEYLFRHSVNFQGEYLFKTLYQEPSNEPIHYSPMPHAVFSSPQVAGVGKTEEELLQEGKNYIAGKGYYKNSAMGDALRSEFGLVKLLFEKESRKLLGAHIVGKEASNMIHLLIVAMTMGATLDDLLRTIYIHPALPEVVRNAARNANLLFAKN